MNKNIVILDKDSVGKEEVYREFFKCPNCNNTELISSFTYCPNCGCKLEWDLTKAFSLREEVIIKTGKLAGISVKVYDFDRRNGQVTIELDENNKVTLNYSDISRKK